MVIKVTPRPPVPDYKILEAIRQSASPDYQRRIPPATQANVQDSIQALLSNVPARNEFTGVLMNRIGRVIGRDMTWTNPLAKFKVGMLEDGDTIEEIMVGLIQASAYDVNRDYMEKDLFSQARPYVQASFHKINREDQYKFTLNDADLRRALRSGDEYGLHSFVAQVMSSAVTSDNWDEYLLMMGLFRQNYDNNGFYKVQVPDVRDMNSNREDAAAMMRMIRTHSNNLKTISERYNAAKMPTHAPAEKLELFLPNEVDAALDVELLASVFNIDRADIHTRKNCFPYEDFNIPGFQGALVSRDFFVVADTHYEVAELPNPAGRYRNHWVQHDQIISLSRFAPAILFTTEPGTIELRFDPPPVTITDVQVMGEDENGNIVPVDKVVRGEQYFLAATVETEPEGGLNTAVRYGIMGGTTYDTRIDKSGGVYVGEQETADELTFTAKSVGDNTIISTTVKVVTGDRLQLWPDPSVIENGTVVPTGATAGSPGEFTPEGATLPPTLAALQGLGALGQDTAWDEGEYIVLGDNSEAHWDGAAWASGRGQAS